MLETLREYGLEYLAMHGEEEATRRAHAEYYLRLAEEAEPNSARYTGNDVVRAFRAGA